MMKFDDIATARVRCRMQQAHISYLIILLMACLITLDHFLIVLRSEGFGVQPTLCQPVRTAKASTSLCQALFSPC
jgi:hypothetical protein